jgi:hypothetical protein
MLDKSLPEQITMLNQSSKHHGGIIFLQQRYKFETIVEGHSFCGKGFCHLFGITYYLRKRLIAEIKNGYVGVIYGDKEGENLNTIDEETARQEYRKTVAREQDFDFEFNES